LGFDFWRSNSLANPNEISMVCDSGSAMLPAHVEDRVLLIATGSDNASTSLFLPFGSVASGTIVDEDGDSIFGADAGEKFIGGPEIFIGVAHVISLREKSQWR